MIVRHRGRLSLSDRCLRNGSGCAAAELFCSVGFGNNGQNGAERKGSSGMILGCGNDTLIIKNESFLNFYLRIAILISKFAIKGSICCYGCSPKSIIDYNVKINAYEKVLYYRFRMSVGCHHGF